MKEESQKGEKFIRGYSLDDGSPKVVLFTDEQLDDIANFCCNDIDGHKSILYVDVTFQLGPFFVFVTSYRNTALYTKNSSPPVCPVLLGPIMLCMLKDKASNITLSQKMTAFIPSLKVYLQAYCTDEENAPREALGQDFKMSVTFGCKIHEKQNIKDKCSKFQISNAVSKVIVDDIFGSEGLVHASTETEYWKKNSRNSNRSGTAWSGKTQGENRGSHPTFPVKRQMKYCIMSQQGCLKKPVSTMKCSAITFPKVEML